MSTASYRKKVYFVYGSRELESMEQHAESSHLELQTQSREGTGCRARPLQVCLWWHTSSSKTTTHKPLQITVPTGLDQLFKYLRLWGTISHSDLSPQYWKWTYTNQLSFLGKTTRLKQNILFPSLFLFCLLYSCPFCLCYSLSLFQGLCEIFRIQ